MSSEIRLEPAGHVALAGISSVAVNAVVHPLATIKNRMMAGQRVSSQGLYNGIAAICAVDAASFGTAYVANDSLGSTAAGILSTPAVAAGEALMANSQVNNQPYSQSLKKAFRPAGLATTVAREVPFTTGVFFFAPLLQSQMQRQWKQTTGENPSPAASLFLQGSAGAVAGAGAGLLTAPVDRIKTMVQISEEPLSIPRAFNSVLSEGGCRALWRGGACRSLYIGISTAGMNVINNVVPQYFPKSLTK